jgi:hypothetical protein
MSSDSQPLFIHLHIPKNAGTTLGRSLRLGIGMWPPQRMLHLRTALGFYNLRHYESRLERIGKLSPKQLARIRLFEAHAGYGLHEFLPTPSAYITLLREPVDRVLSIYFTHRARGRIAPDLSLGEFAQTHDPGRLWWIDNAQVRYLAGERGRILNCPPGEVTRSHLELAKERLENEFFFFGLVEQFDLSVNLLRRRLGWKRLYYSTSNVTKSRRPKDEMLKEDLDAVRAINELDLELYEHASKLFGDAVDREGADFAREVERFPAANRMYNRTVGRMYWVFSAYRAIRRWRAKRRGEIGPPPILD